MGELLTSGYLACWPPAAGGPGAPVGELLTSGGYGGLVTERRAPMLSHTILQCYTLEGHKPVVSHDFAQWNEWMATADRRVAQAEIGTKYIVSTVFLGIQDLSSSDTLFETMVFSVPTGDSLDEWCWWYSTWEEAEVGHFTVCSVLEEWTKTGAMALHVCVS